MAGWKIGPWGDDVPKCVICVAPHTSNWDFIIAISFYKSLGGNPHFLMKKDWFFFPVGNILRAIGGIPVNRSKNSSLSDQMAEMFRTHNDFQLALSPEGTRKKTTQWKTGFYYIALKANVPITLAYLDYTQKEIGVKAIFHPTGDADKDIEKIKSYYKDVHAKHPHKFSL